MRYQDVADFIKAGLINLGYKPVPRIDPGPAQNPLLQKLSPQELIFLTVGGGAGTNLEQLYDRPFISVSVRGKQNDYAGAERLANDVDSLFLSVTGNAVVGSARVLYVTRTGGRPQLVDKGADDRYNFTCSYVANAQIGL